MGDTSNNIWNTLELRPGPVLGQGLQEAYIKQDDRVLPKLTPGWETRQGDRRLLPHASYMYCEGDMRYDPCQDVTFAQLPWFSEPSRATGDVRMLDFPTVRQNKWTNEDGLPINATEDTVQQILGQAQHIAKQRQEAIARDRAAMYPGEGGEPAAKKQKPNEEEQGGGGRSFEKFPEEKGNEKEEENPTAGGGGGAEPPPESAPFTGFNQAEAQKLAESFKTPEIDVTQGIGSQLPNTTVLTQAVTGALSATASAFSTIATGIGSLVEEKKGDMFRLNFARPGGRYEEKEGKRVSVGPAQVADITDPLNLQFFLDQLWESNYGKLFAPNTKINSGNLIAKMTQLYGKSYGLKGPRKLQTSNMQAVSILANAKEEATLDEIHNILDSINALLELPEAGQYSEDELPVRGKNVQTHMTSNMMPGTDYIGPSTAVIQQELETMMKMSKGGKAADYNARQIRRVISEDMFGLKSSNVLMSPLATFDYYQNRAGYNIWFGEGNNSTVSNEVWSRRRNFGTAAQDVAFQSSTIGETPNPASGPTTVAVAHLGPNGTASVASNPAMSGRRASVIK